MTALQGMTQDRWNELSPVEKDKIRDLSGLTRELLGFEGWRVEVIRPDGEKDRFIVGRSTGWRPCHTFLRCAKAKSKQSCKTPICNAIGRQRMPTVRALAISTHSCNVALSQACDPRQPAPRKRRSSSANGGMKEGRIMANCRLCHNYALERDCVKYAHRHYAHFRCYLDAGKPISALSVYDLEHFPYRLLRDRGLLDEAERIIDARYGRKAEKVA